MSTVLDTHVLVSTLIGKSESVQVIRRDWRSRLYTLSLSEPLLTEVRDVLARPHLQKYLAGEAVDTLLNELTRYGEFLAIQPPYSKSPDPDDFLLAMLELPETETLVTGDKKLLAPSSFAGKEIISPTTFAAKLAASNDV